MSERLVWKEISREEFFRTVGSLNVHPRIINDKYPYNELWITPSGQELGKSIGQVNGPDRYFVPEKEVA